MRIRSVPDSDPGGNRRWCPKIARPRVSTSSAGAGENMTLPWERRLVKSGFITGSVIRATQQRMGRANWRSAETWIAPAGLLSGGNQQKVLLARGLARTRGAHPRRADARRRRGHQGGDVWLIRELARGQVWLVVISSELDEILALSTASWW